MKNIFLIASVLLLFGCSRDDDKNISNPNPNNPTIQKQIESDMENGDWRITNFNEDGNDKTQNFNGYVFKFNSDGSISVSNVTSNYSGLCGMNDFNLDDDSQNNLHFNILFYEANNFLELNDDWEVISHSETKLLLQDISGGNGGIDFLTFEKN